MSDQTLFRDPAIFETTPLPRDLQPPRRPDERPRLRPAAGRPGLFSVEHRAPRAAGHREDDGGAPDLHPGAGGDAAGRAGARLLPDRTGAQCDLQPDLSRPLRPYAALVRGCERADPGEGRPAPDRAQGGPRRLPGRCRRPPPGRDAEPCALGDPQDVRGVAGHPHRGVSDGIRPEHRFLPLAQPGDVLGALPERGRLPALHGGGGAGDTGRAGAWSGCTRAWCRRRRWTSWWSGRWRRATCGSGWIW